MLGLPGTAFVYQGEELGLPEDFDLTEDEIQDPNWERSGHYFKGRDGCRVPLPWQSDGPAFGFNATGASWLPQPAWFAQYATNRPAPVLCCCRIAQTVGGQRHGLPVLVAYQRRVSGAAAWLALAVRHGCDGELL